MLELAERLADLHIKRARIRELIDAADKLKARDKGRIYRKAGKALFSEIQRLETLIEQEL